MPARNASAGRHGLPATPPCLAIAGSIFFWSRFRQQATDRLSLHNTKQVNIFPSIQKVLAQPGTLGLLYIVCLENCDAKMYYGQHINLTCGNDRFS
jgi:hypothetical protein